MVGTLPRWEVVSTGPGLGGTCNGRKGACEECGIV